ncbi:MAG: hypothetical protein ACI9UA_005287 [Pseudoalteromonas tetraodonis]|jgi:hypothetical protein
MAKNALYNFCTVGLLAFALNASAATTVLHFRVSDSDEATVAGGTVPGIDGSPDGTVAGVLTLSEDTPDTNVPSGAGNRSMAFTNTQVITIPGTQQLSHTAVIAEGGFTFETWFKWDGGGTLNAMIDYAGTEKFRILPETGVLDMNFAQGSGLQVLANPTANEWHYVAAVFEHDGDPISADLMISGTLTWYFDSSEPTGTAPVTKDDFGDSLVRTIGVGGHPLGFGADFHNGLMFETRVSLGALSSTELLFGGKPPELKITELIYDNSPGDPSVSVTWTSSPNTQYRVEFSTDLKSWIEAADAQGAVDETTTTLTHFFLPDYPELISAERLYYRVVAPSE